MVILSRKFYAYMLSYFREMAHMAVGHLLSLMVRYN